MNNVTQYLYHGITPICRPATPSAQEKNHSNSDLINEIRTNLDKLMSVAGYTTTAHLGKGDVFTNSKIENFVRNNPSVDRAYDPYIGSLETKYLFWVVNIMKAMPSTSPILSIHKYDLFTINVAHLFHSEIGVDVVRTFVEKHFNDVWPIYLSVTNSYGSIVYATKILHLSHLDFFVIEIIERLYSFAEYDEEIISIIPSYVTIELVSLKRGT